MPEEEEEGGFHPAGSAFDRAGDIHRDLLTDAPSQRRFGYGPSER